MPDPRSCLLCIIILLVSVSPFSLAFSPLLNSDGLKLHSRAFETATGRGPFVHGVCPQLIGNSCGKPCSLQSNRKTTINMSDESNSDWSSFRAKLVAQEQGQTVDSGVSIDDGWVYDGGTLVEQGTVLLGGSQQEYGFGLRQQYFHKCVLLILAHDEKVFTQGFKPKSQSSPSLSCFSLILFESTRASRYHYE